MIRGSSRIGDVTDKFKKLMSQVQMGIAELLDSQAMNNREITSLTADNAIIDSEVAAARKLEDALLQFMPSTDK